MPSPEKELNDLFRIWGKPPAGGGWTRIGYFPLDLRGGGIEALSINLIRVSPVCVMLLVTAFPTTTYAKRFGEIISRDVRHTHVIYRLGLFSRHWRMGGVLPSRVRQQELEEFFLEMNREAVRILRRYINRGWSVVGPLPSLQVFTLRRSSEPEENQADNSEFWRSLSLTRIPEMNYTDGNGLEITPPDSLDRGTFTAPYRCIVDTERYLSEARTKSRATSESALYHILELDLLHPLLPLMALRESLRRTADKLGGIRDRISPYLVLKRQPITGIRAALGLLFMPLRLNSLYFETSRLTESSVRRMLDRPPRLSIARKTQSDQDDGRLTDDLVFQIRSLQDHVREHLRLIRGAYREVWSFAVQWILVVLTIATVVIAIVQLWRY